MQVVLDYEAPAAAASLPPASGTLAPQSMKPPRGALLCYRATDAELLALQARCDARGVNHHAAVARKVKRSAADEAQLQAICEWLQEHKLDVFGTVTFRDDYADPRHIYSLPRALEDVARGLHDCPMAGGHKGFIRPYILTGEWHPSGRKVPHVHIALHSGPRGVESVCADLFAHFSRSRGRSRFEPMRDVDSATLYALKDTVKGIAADPDSVRSRLWTPRHIPKSSSRCSA
jgi:hypothetical protein